MYAIIWRFGVSSPWTVERDPVPTEQDARTAINNQIKASLAKREYRIVPLGEVETWRDPFAEQKERDACAD